MADSTATIGLTVKIDGIDREISSLKDLKQAKKDATDAFLRGDKDAAKALADLKDKTEDLTDATQTLKGSGVEKLTSSFSQLKDGFSSFDGDKISTAFKGIGAAMKAIPLLLIIEGIRYLVENFDELSKGSGLVAKVLQFVGTVVNGLKDSLTDLADKMGIVNKELDQMSENLEKYGNQVTETIGKQNNEYDRHINLLKAQGKEAVWLEKLKQENIIRTNKALVEQIQAYAATGRELDKGQKDLLTLALTNIQNAVNQKEIIEATADKKRTDAEQKAYLERQANAKAHKNEILRIQAEESDAWWAERLAEEAQYKKEDEEAKQRELDEQARLEKLGADQDAQMQRYIDNKNKEAQATEEAEIKKREHQKETFNQYMEGTKSSLQSAQQITDIFFSYKLGKAKGDAKAENDIRKKQFNVNKAFGITNAVIDGIGAVQKALNNPYPLNIVLAAISGIAAAANIAKIASTKFEPTSSGDSGGGGATSIPVPAPPTINTPNANTNSNTTFDENGKRIGEGEKSGQPTINVKATVGVDEITDKSNRVQVLEQQSTF